MEYEHEVNGQYGCQQDMINLYPQQTEKCVERPAYNILWSIILSLVWNILGENANRIDLRFFVALWIHIYFVAKLYRWQYFYHEYELLFTPFYLISQRKKYKKHKIVLLSWCVKQTTILKVQMKTRKHLPVKMLSLFFKSKG